jgi:type VI protein secretion system component VasK
MIFFSNFWSEAGFFWWVLAFVACLIALFGILPDLFRDKKLHGWAKALWVLFLVFVPFVTVIVYVIARGRGMAQRRLSELDEELEANEVFGGGARPVDQIARAKEMLDSGAITQEDYDKLRADGNA